MELVNESFTSSYSGSSIVHSLQSRIIGGYARLELMHGFKIWGVGGPSFPQVEASTKWSL